MKPQRWSPGLAAITLLTAQAQVARTFESTFVVNQAIPDGSFSGLVNAQTLFADVAAIESVAVTLVLSPIGEGGFLGDLHATLQHEGGYAVLLNRPGKRPGSSFGYSDDVSVHITLSDDAPADIHQYRLTLNGNESLPLADDLTGRWQPDGRAVDPMSVSLDSPRTATLDSFAGATLAGRWTLVVADVIGGGDYRLDSWTLDVTLVPEPVGVLAIFAFGALGWSWLQRRARRDAGT